MTVRSLLKAVRRDEGNALVELAVALPVLVLIFAGTADLGRVFYTSIALTNAARAGAQWGASTVARSGDSAGMESAAVASTNVSGITADASRLCQCATSAGVFSSTAPSANDCTTAEATSCPTGHRVITVTVETDATFNMITSLLPGVPSSIPLARTATLRVVN